MRWPFGGADALRSSIPWIMLSATVALTFAGWIGMERSRVDEARAQFERHTQKAEVAMRARMLAYEQIVRAGAAHVASTPGITRRNWHHFVGQLELSERFPGVGVLGFAERVPAAARGAHVRRVRAEGLADYDIGPAGERPQYFPAALSEPFTPVASRMAGYDAFADPARRSAMERARDSGEATITGRLTLAGDAYRPARAIQPGFVMYVPVYRGEAMPVTIDARAEALSGFVFAVFRTHDLMRGILDESSLQVLDMRVYDGVPDGAGSELMDTRAATTPRARAETKPALSRVVAFPIGGRTWTVVFASRPEYDALAAGSRSLGVLGAGLLAALLLFILTVSLVSTWNRAHQLSMRDPLTGLYNRRYLDETIGRELPRARRQGESVGVIALDIDHFKRLNDTFGHDAGDFVLRMLSEQMRAATRDSDIACRFGGEEFGIILPGASLAVARARAEALRAAVEALRLEFDGKPLGTFTVSAGVASMPPHAQDWTFTLQTADRALYAAKQQGRNRVVAAGLE